MKRFAKIILAALAAVAILFVVALIGINLYLQSGDVQQRIRLATEQAIGMPVAVKRTLYLPWRGLTLSGLSLPDATIPGARLVEAPTFSVRFQFWPLLSRRFVISEVSLNEPHLVLRQTPEKKWVIVPPRPVRQPGPEKTQPAPPSVPSGGPGYAVELRSFAIHNGSADIYDYRGAPLGRVRGLEVEGRLLPGGGRVEGSVRIEEIEIAGMLHPNRLRAEFVHEGEELTVSDLKFALADGKVRAHFTVVNPRKSDPAFEMRGSIEDVSLPTLVAEAQGDESGITGRLAGEFNLRGNPTNAATLTGGGALRLDSAQLRPFDGIQQLGMILRIDELQLLKLSESHMAFEIRKERFWITDLRLRTDNIIITGQGPIRFNGKMDLDGRFLINPKLEDRLSMIISDKFRPSSEPGYKEVAFEVTGKTSRPETDLAYQVTGFRFDKMGALAPLLKGFFQAPKPEASRPSSDKTTDK